MKHTYEPKDFEIDWKSFLSAGEITEEEFRLARKVYRDPSLCSTSELSHFFRMQKRLQPHFRVPRARAQAMDYSPAEAHTINALAALREATHDIEQNLGFGRGTRTVSLKEALCWKIFEYNEDFRAEWNRMLGFNLFKL